ncbi:MAG: hypothetical protein ACYDCL_15755 [Myxococcales bacterium]
MRAAALLLVLSAAATARAGATLLVPEFADSGGGGATHARLEMLRALGAYPDVQIAPLSRYKRLAAKHRLNPRQLGTGHAASILGRYEGLDGVLMGIVVNGGAGPVLRLVLYDPTGTSVFRTDLPLEGGGALPPQSAESAAGSIARALGVTAAPREAPPPPAQPQPQAAQPAPSAAPATAASDRYPKNAEVAPAPEESEPAPKAGEPLVTIALALPLAMRSYSYSVQQIPALTFDTASPYAGIAGDLAIFPLARASYWLQGIGFLAEGSAGFISSTAPTSGGGTQAFGSQDIRAAADLTYRLLIHAFASQDLDPSVGLRLGLAWFHFGTDGNAPTNLHLEPIDRVAPKVGLEYIQGIASWLRIGVGGAVYPAATPGATYQAELGQASSFGWSVELTLSGLVGLAGLGYAVKVDYLSFSDSLNGGGVLQGATGSSESYVDIWLGLSYAFY